LDRAVTGTVVVPTGNRAPDAGLPLTVTGATPPDVVAVYVTATGDPVADTTDMLDGHETTSLGGAVTVPAVMFTCTVTTMADPVSGRMANTVWYWPTANLDVRKVNVSVPLFTPVVGDTVSQDVVEFRSVHLSVPVPALLTFIVREGTLVPTFACTLIDVGLADSVGCAAARRGTTSAEHRNRTTNKTDRAIRVMGTLFVAARPNRPLPGDCHDTQRRKLRACGAEGSDAARTLITDVGGRAT
jgi:hypothetical protein